MWGNPSSKPDPFADPLWTLLVVTTGIMRLLKIQSCLHTHSCFHTTSAVSLHTPGAKKETGFTLCTSTHTSWALPHTHTHTHSWQFTLYLAWPAPTNTYTPAQKNRWRLPSVFNIWFRCTSIQTDAYVHTQTNTHMHKYLYMSGTLRTRWQHKLYFL